MDCKNSVKENQKLLSLIAILSGYDFFEIVINDRKKFYSTGIEQYATRYIEFKRIFAKSKFTNTPIKDVVALSKTEFDCYTQDAKYRITAIHKKPNEMIIRPRQNWNEISDFMEVEYIGEQFIEVIKELDLIILVVDPYLLGELDSISNRQIQKLINTSLHGISNSMQMCRTICFQIKINDPFNRIYAGIYDLERRCSITSCNLYDERNIEVISDELYKKSKRLIEYAKRIFSEVT